MKKIVFFVALLLTGLSNAQEANPIPQISVNGEGKIKIISDQALITATVESKGTIAKEVKKQNDIQIDAVLKFIKKMNLNPADYKMQRVSLNPQYDYAKKKHNYNATQTIEIVLKDLSKYDELMEGLVDNGVNRIDNVTFQSSKMTNYLSEVRKLAMKDAKQKATDYVSVLGQKVGKAIMITDNSQNHYPQPVYARMKTTAMSDEAASLETLATGEIEVTANVNVSFALE